MPWFDFALRYHFIILNDHKTKTKFKIKKKNQRIKKFFFDRKRYSNKYWEKIAN